MTASCHCQRRRCCAVPAPSTAAPPSPRLRPQRCGESRQNSLMKCARPCHSWQLANSAPLQMYVLPACMPARSHPRVTLPLTAIIHRPSVHPQQSVLSQTEDVVAKLLSSRLQDAKAVLPSAGALLNEVAQVRTHTAPPPPPMWCVTHPRFPTVLAFSQLIAAALSNPGPLAPAYPRLLRLIFGGVNSATK